jgi:hypothetical protein
VTDINNIPEPYSAFDGMIEYILRQQFIDKENILDRTKKLSIHIPGSENVIKKTGDIFRNSLQLAMEGKWEDYLTFTLENLQMRDDFDIILENFKLDYQKGSLPNQEGSVLPYSVVFMILIKEIKKLIQDRIYDELCNRIGQILAECGICEENPSRGYLDSMVSTYGPQFSLILNLEILRYFSKTLDEEIDPLDKIIKEQFNKLINTIKKEERS